LEFKELDKFATVSRSTHPCSSVKTKIKRSTDLAEMNPQIAADDPL
jgi:hypothetical protein